jgi:hypothetical protein
VVIGNRELTTDEMWNNKELHDMSATEDDMDKVRRKLAREGKVVPVLN